MVDTVILDWSGTLVDDLDAVLVGTNEALGHFGHPALTLEDFRREFELPVHRFYERLIPGADFAELEASFHRGFRTAFDRIRPLDGAEAFLAQTSAFGIRLMVLTTLDVDNAHRQLEDFGWGRYFDGIHAGIVDKVPHLVDLVEREPLDPARTVFVGDLPHDIEAGRAAGVRTCGVLTGYSDHAKLANCEPDFLLGSVTDLDEHLRASARREGGVT